MLLILKFYLGGLIRDDCKDTLTAVHIQLSKAIMGTAPAGCRCALAEGPDHMVRPARPKPAGGLHHASERRKMRNMQTIGPATLS